MIMRYVNFLSMVAIICLLQLCLVNAFMDFGGHDDVDDTKGNDEKIADAAADISSKVNFTSFFTFLEEEQQRQLLEHEQRELQLITPQPSNSNSPTITPQPSVSSMPTNQPSVSNAPTVSPMPTRITPSPTTSIQPTTAPVAVTTPNPTANPTPLPTQNPTPIPSTPVPVPATSPPTVSPTPEPSSPPTPPPVTASLSNGCLLPT